MAKKLRARKNSVTYDYKPIQMYQSAIAQIRNQLIILENPKFRDILRCNYFLLVLDFIGELFKVLGYCLKLYSPIKSWNSLIISIVKSITKYDAKVMFSEFLSFC